MKKIKRNYKYLFLIIPFMIYYYYYFCLKVIIYNDYSLEYFIISLLLMFFPLIIYVSIVLTFKRKYYKSILVILTYTVAFSCILYFKIDILENKKIYDGTRFNIISVEEQK